MPGRTVAPPLLEKVSVPSYVNSPTVTPTDTLVHRSHLITRVGIYEVLDVCQAQFEHSHSRAATQAVR